MQQDGCCWWLRIDSSLFISIRREGETSLPTMEYKAFPSIWLGHFKTIGHPQPITVLREILGPERFRIVRSCPLTLSMRWSGVDIQIFGILLGRKGEIYVGSAYTTLGTSKIGMAHDTLDLSRRSSNKKKYWIIFGRKGGRA